MTESKTEVDAEEDDDDDDDDNGGDNSGNDGNNRSDYDEDPMMDGPLRSVTKGKSSSSKPLRKPTPSKAKKVSFIIPTHVTNATDIH